MVKEQVAVNNLTGLHLRPAGVLCREAMNFKCSIQFTFGSYTSNVKSVLSVLGACVKRGDVITLICDGEDEEEALRYMVKLIREGLGE